jgi:hypothetical protein
LIEKNDFFTQKGVDALALASIILYLKSHGCAMRALYFDISISGTEVDFWLNLEALFHNNCL